MCKVTIKFNITQSSLFICLLNALSPNGVQPVNTRILHRSHATTMFNKLISQLCETACKCSITFF